VSENGNGNSKSSRYNTAGFWLDKIPGTAGIKSQIANRAGCDWHTASKYCDPETSPFPTVARVYQDECEKIDDLAEVGLIEALKRQEPWAIKYRLGTKGRNRGYGERLELTGAGGGPLKLYIGVTPDDWDEPEV
jgi:hypothetical protein